MLMKIKLKREMIKIITIKLFKKKDILKKYNSFDNQKTCIQETIIK